MKVSKRGQIVIPSDFRNRLDIKPGMEVNFRIRGNFLILEIDTDVKGDIKYLEDKKGKLGENDFDETQLHEIVEDLLTQQFYDSDDFLTDRIAKKKIKIRGSDSIVKKSIIMITNSAMPWFEGDFVQALKNFSSDLDLDFHELISRYVYKLRSMELGGPEMMEMMGGEVLVSMAIGEALSQFRTRVGDIVTELLIKEATTRGFVIEYGIRSVDESITKYLAEEYSILMNLRVLREFARVNLQSVAQRDFNILSLEMLDKIEEIGDPRRKKKRAKGKKSILIEGEDEPTNDVQPAMPDFDFD